MWGHKTRSHQAASLPLVAMMKATEDGMRNDLTVSLHRAPTDRRLELERSMRPRGVVVVDVLTQHRAKVSLAQWNDVVNALSAQRPVPITRSATALACGARTGVSTVSMPMRRARATKFPP